MIGKIVTLYGDVTAPPQLTPTVVVTGGIVADALAQA